MQIAKIGSVWGTYSWSTGFVSPKRFLFVDEARKYPEAVINRLMREGKWDEAEEVMDKFITIRRRC